MTLIVVIEDNVQNARMAIKLLKRAGYEVLLAEDGESGLTTVFENKPDLILIDLGLPDIDGQTVIGLVRQQESLKEIPIIAFTAWPPDEAHDMAKRYGCDGVITKPINTRTFAEKIGAFASAKNAPGEDDGESENTLTTEIETAVKSDTASEIAISAELKTPGTTVVEETKTVDDSVSDADMVTEPDKDAIENMSDNPADSSQVNTGD